MNNQLILRASRKNRDEIKQALAALDTPARQLVIRVTQNRDAVMNRSGAGPSAASATIMCASPSRRRASLPVAVPWSSSRGSSAVGGRWWKRSTRTASAAQSVQVVEGGGPSSTSASRSRCRCSRSCSVPAVPSSPTLRSIATSGRVLRRAATGGDRVMLEISPQFDTPGNAGYGSVNTQRVSTSVSGRLGEWMELAAAGNRRLARIAAIFPSAPPTCATTAASGCWSRK